MLKPIFISLYLIVAVVVTAFAARSMIATLDFISWGGVILANAPFVVVVGWITVFKNTPRTSARFPILTILGVLGTGLAVLGYTDSGDATAAVLALLGFISFLVYVYWYSSFGREASDALQLGNQLPDFDLKDTKGATIHSASLTDTPTIWIFYRGNWCPLCMAQIKEIAGQYRELQDKGVRVALVSPQPHKFTVGLAKQFDVPFDFLTDENNRAAHTLGIAISHGVPTIVQPLGYDGDTVMPTVIITDAAGKIIWAHETDNYRVRPDPDVYLNVLTDAGIVAAN